MTKLEFLNLVGSFTWLWGRHFHIETSQGNFLWSDPNYDGDNTVRPCGTYQETIREMGIDYGRDKGQHSIKDYCGPDVTLIE